MAGERLQDASDRDLAALQGRWQQVGFEQNGLVNPPDEHGGIGAITTIDGCRFSVIPLTVSCC